MKIRFIKSVGVFVAILSTLTSVSCSSEIELGHESVIMYTDSEGEVYPRIAKSGEVIIKFDESNESIQRHIIDECGGEVIEYYPLLRTYLVRTDPNMEMDFIFNARRQYGVKDVNLNTVSQSMGINMNIIDQFTQRAYRGSQMIHGEYCYEAAQTAYPECPDCIVKVSYDVKGDFSGATEQKFLNDIFSSTMPDDLILINMSYGYSIYKVEFDKEHKGQYNYVKDNEGNWVEVTWQQTFSDEYGDLERKWWVMNYIEGIRKLSANLITLSETNPNFMIFKSSGNEYCHEIDNVIFNNLSEKLTTEQLEVIKNHLIHVSAKDSSRAVQGELYAEYANSPLQYCPYLTMVDISHLTADGTSFSCPYMLGKVARLFDIMGYKSLDSNSNMGYNVIEMMTHIKNATRKYAERIKQPGLYTDNYDPKMYSYNKRYTFTGILRRDCEDLCETGNPETFYYLEIEPINIQAEGVSDIEEPLINVTRLQIDNYDPQVSIGQEITVSGELLFHIAGCHIHTDAYLVDTEIKDLAPVISQSEEIRQEDTTQRIYYYNDLNSVITGVLHSEIITSTDFAGEPYYYTIYYLLLDEPIIVKDRNEGNPRLPYCFPAYNQTKIRLYGHFNPKEYVGLRVIVAGKFQTEITLKPERGVVMCVNKVY